MLGDIARKRHREVVAQRQVGLAARLVLAPLADDVRPAVELDPGESAVAEAGTLMYKDSAVRMETVFGDGSAASASAMPGGHRHLRR